MQQCSKFARRCHGARVYCRAVLPLAQQRAFFQHSRAAHIPLRSLSTSSSSSSDPAGPSWQRRAFARVKLTTEEWWERFSEWRENCVASARQFRLQDFSLNDYAYRTHARWLDANARFDDWFNAQWPLWMVAVRSRFEELKRKFDDKSKSAPAPSQKQEKQGLLDVPALLLVGAGVGTVAQGAHGLGLFITIFGAARIVKRFVVCKVEEEDREGLFRWCPVPLSPTRRALIFNWLWTQVYVAKKRREGDYDYFSFNQNSGHRHKSMDPLNDYTPERLFDDTMKSVIAHPRVLDSIGGQVKVVKEPDKVVYRIVEGIAEVYLSWRILGVTAGAEIQVKATGSLLDYIYVFPEPASRYQQAPSAFVIRPHGGWSMDKDDLPRYMKSPFGKKGDTDRMFVNRSGVFEMDWSIRDFKHGKERGQWWS